MKKIAFIFLICPALFALTPLEIAQKAKEATDGYGSSQTTMQMILIDINKNRSVREIQSYSQEGLSGKGDKSLIEFNKPLDVKGVKFLTHEKISSNNDQWLYLPALKRVKRINSSNKSGSFMGSEFSYEDISSREPTKYTYSKEAKEVNLEGKTVYMYERYPKDENSGYTKQILWVEKNHFLIVKIDFFDRKKELLKTGVYKWNEKTGTTYRAKEITMNNHQNKKGTILKYLDDKIHLNLDESLFTKRMLTR